MKRFIAGLLTLIMTFSMISMPNVFAADESYGEMIASDLVSGMYTDITADADEDYVYTIVGSDGSVAEIDTEAMMHVEQVYVRLKGENGVVSSNQIQEGVYLLVNATLEKAVKAAGSCPYDDFVVARERIVCEDGERSAWEWSLQKDGDNAFKFIAAASANTDAPQYLTLVKFDKETSNNGSDPAVMVSAAADVGQTLTIGNTKSGSSNSNTYYANAVYIGGATQENGDVGYLNARGSKYLGTWDGADSGSCFYLYKKGYGISEKVLKKVTGGVGSEEDYSAGWADYAAALENASIVHENASDAANALSVLKEKVEALETIRFKKVYTKYDAVPTEARNYVIITERMTNHALTNEEVPENSEWSGNWVIEQLAVENNQITASVDEKFVWKITPVTGGFTIEDQNGKYIKIKDNNSRAGLELIDSKEILQISSLGGNLFQIGNGTGYLNCHKQNGSAYIDAGMGTYDVSADAGNKLFLYQETVYVRDVAIKEIQNLLDGTQEDYVPRSWAVYEKALEEVYQPFASEATARQALIKLREAANQLEMVDLEVLKEVYVKVKPDFSQENQITDGSYLIMGARVGYNANKLVKYDFSYQLNDSGSMHDTPKDEIQGEYAEYEWHIVNAAKNGATVTCYIQPANNEKEYVYISSDSDKKGVQLGDNTKNNRLLTIKAGNGNLEHSLSIGSGGGWFNHRADRSPVGVGTYTSDATSDQGSAFYLYKKQYKVDVAPFVAMVNAEKVTYPTDVYNSYLAALDNAKNYVNTASEAYAAYMMLVEAAMNLTEGTIWSSSLDTVAGWMDDTASNSKYTELSFANTTSSLVQTETPLSFALSTASAFELLAECGRNTGMVMAVVKGAEGNTLRAYLVDTYYDVENNQKYVPIVRDMSIPEGASVDVYGCLVKNVINARKNTSTMSIRGRALEVTTDDIVMAVLQELGLENELEVTDVAVSYMDEESVLKGGTVSGVNTYALTAVAEEETNSSATYSVSIQGCRIYRETQTVKYIALSELLANGKTAFIAKDSTESETFVLEEYQKTGPQNEVYLEPGESIVIGLADAPAINYAVRLRSNAGTDSYETLAFKAIEGSEGYAAIITNNTDSTMALGMIKMSAASGAAPTEFLMTPEMAEAVVATMNAEVPEVVNPFEDVKEDDYFFDAVLWAVKENITTGVSETLFAPGKDCTRAQVVTFLWRAAGQPEVTNTENPFVDVKTGSYYEKAVLWAVENGITTGVDAEHFAPNNACTRAQFVTFLWRAEGQPEVANAENPFVDVAADSYYEEAVCWAAENDITTGVDAEHFAPQDTCLRRQVVTFLYRAMSE